MKKRDLLSIADLLPKEIQGLLNRAIAMKMGAQSQCLAGKSVAMLFEKQSLRTRVSFDVAVHQLGGHAIYLGREEVGLGNREGVSDVGRVLSRYVDAIIARTYSHQTLVDLASYATIPVVNALSDAEHPCQALGDLLTIQEHLPSGRLKGVSVAFIGDGNNVASSLALGAAAVGANFVIASPPGYELPEHIAKQSHALARTPGAVIRQVRDPKEAARHADVVYTDVWVSMGQESQGDQRRRDFQGYQVTPELMALASPKAVFMHPLPAHRGEEVAEGMLGHRQSVVFDQAENRLHIQKAVLEFLMDGQKG
ncbi:MAG: ornithine carbamoyltransferase [Dehalococcoidia bacterium]|nr:ornithine carbamoyltransferase [Dehalococcoidia bacterium]